MSSLPPRLMKTVFITLQANKRRYFQKLIFQTFIYTIYKIWHYFIQKTHIRLMGHFMKSIRNLAQGLLEKVYQENLDISLELFIK